MKFKRLPCISVSALLLVISLISSLSTRVSSSDTSEYREVNLEYLIAHVGSFQGTKIMTSGVVKYLFSFYMYEDFWLCTQNGRGMPVVTRFAGLFRPVKDSFIEVLGAIEYCDLEGGFYYFNASSWTYSGASYDFDITQGNETSHVSIISNSTISSFSFQPSENTISFNVTGPDGTSGSCRISIPRTLISSPYIIRLDGEVISEPQFEVLPSSSEAYSFIYVVYLHSDHIIEITTAVTVPESPSFLIPPLLLLTTLLAMVMPKRVRKASVKSTSTST